MTTYTNMNNLYFFANTTSLNAINQNKINTGKNAKPIMKYNIGSSGAPVSRIIMKVIASGM